MHPKLHVCSSEQPLAPHVWSGRQESKIANLRVGRGGERGGEGKGEGRGEGRRGVGGREGEKERGGKGYTCIKYYTTCHC